MGAIIGPVIGAAGSLAGGILGGNAAKKAANQEADALRQALSFQKGVYGTAQGNLQPFISGGQNSLQAILGALGLGGAGPAGVTNAFSAFQQTPGYQFPLQQGNLALTRQLASMGLNGSGAALRDASTFNSGYASQNYQNYLSQLFNLAGSGQNAAGTLGQIGTNIGTQNLTANTGIGAALGAGTVGAQNNLNTGIGQLFGALNSNPPNGTDNSPLSKAWGWLSNQFGSGSNNGGGLSSSSYASMLPPAGAYPTGGIV